MLQALGILLIINALVITGFWINSGHVNTAGAIILCTLAVFVGFAFIFSDRITELTVRNVGTIKAAAKQAVVAAESDLAGIRLLGTEGQKQEVLPVLLDGDPATALPPLLRGRVRADFRKEEEYFVTAFDLILSLYGIAPSDPAVADLRQSLREPRMR